MNDIAKQALEKAIAKAQSLGAEQSEAIFIQSQGTSVLYRMGEKEINSSKTSGVGVRVIKENKQSCISTSDLNQVEEVVEKAMNLIQYLPGNKHNSLPPPDSHSKNYQENLQKLDLLDRETVKLDTLLTKAQGCEEIALRQSHISNSEGAECSQYHRKRIMLNSQGFSAEYSTSLSSMSCCVVAKSKGGMERDYHYSRARHFADLDSEEEVALKATENTVMRLNPKKISSKQCPVIFDRRVAESLLQDIAAAINGSSLVHTQTFLKGKLGQQVFSEGMQITNDPHMRRGIGSLPCDHEGVENSERIVVRKGNLESYILDWTTSREMGMENTANAKRGLALSPQPGADNLFISGGNLTLEQLFKDMGSGMWVREIIGDGTNLVTGDYSVGVSGMWIENGEVAYPISEITLSGNLVDMLKTTVPADDLIFNSSVCSPSLLLDGVTLGGV